jgi:hypothetical protein
VKPSLKKVLPLGPPPKGEVCQIIYNQKTKMF